MKISVELTLSPLQDDFEPIVIHFIKKLRASGLKIIENPLSTQVYGDYHKVMKVLNTEIEDVFKLMKIGVLYLKIVKTDRHNYEPSF
jgi:uncharacterized protein YqgV (UPF0045/DUF77 family)